MRVKKIASRNEENRSEDKYFTTGQVTTIQYSLRLVDLIVADMFAIPSKNRYLGKPQETDTTVWSLSSRSHHQVQQPYFL